MKILISLLFLCASTLAAQTNPFFAESALPYEAPPFDKIHDADFQPAIEEGMKQALAEVDAIANNPDAPTFGNTIEPLAKDCRCHCASPLRCDQPQSEAVCAREGGL